MATDIFNKGQEKHYKLTKTINSLLLGAHVCLLSMFAYLHVTLMVYVNIFSVLFYIFLFFVYKKSVVRYVFVVYIEVLVHMFLATISVGWDGGFQLYTFCLIPCAFLCDYLNRTDGGKTMYPIGISTSTVILFLGSRFFCIEYVSLYTLESASYYMYLYVYNGVLTFIFLMIYMSVFGNSILDKEKQLGNMAELDALTKLPNRYLMHGWLSTGFKNANEDNGFVVAMLDIDDFKMLNDTYGHECGDSVLRQVAREIGQISDDNLKVCRWGGEEFVFMNTGVDAYQQMYVSVEELRKCIEQKIITFRDYEIHITVTIGIAKHHSEDNNFQDTIKRADDRLYEGKEKGKNCIIGE